MPYVYSQTPNPESSIQIVIYNKILTELTLTDRFSQINIFVQTVSNAIQSTLKSKNS